MPRCVHGKRHQERHSRRRPVGGSGLEWAYRSRVRPTGGWSTRMTRRPFAEMVSVGVAVPPGVLTNADLTRMLDTSDEWIVERTGIRERRIARPEQSVAMLSQEASEKALQRAGMAATDLDAIVLATASPDRLLPSTACDLQALLGANRAAAFDIGAAFPGFLFAHTVAERLIAP